MMPELDKSRCRLCKKLIFKGFSAWGDNESNIFCKGENGMWGPLHEPEPIETESSHEPKSMNVTITGAEWRAMIAVVKAFARMRGEDTIGAIMLTTGHTILTDAQVVELSRKIDTAELGLPPRPVA
jgi:hypothetical protein